MNNKWILIPALALTVSLSACNTSNEKPKQNDDKVNETVRDEPDAVDKGVTEDDSKDKDQDDKKSDTLSEPEKDSNLEEDSDNATTSTKGVHDIVTVTDGLNYSDIKVSPNDAFDKFLSAHQNTRVTEIKLDTKYNDLEYKIEGYDDTSEYQMRIDAVSSDVKSDDTKSLDKGDKSDGAILKEDVGKVEDILNKGIEEAGDGVRFKKWSLEDNDGRLQFEIEFKDHEDKDVEYTYDLSSGELIKKGD